MSTSASATALQHRRCPPRVRRDERELLDQSLYRAGYPGRLAKDVRELRVRRPSGSPRVTVSQPADPTHVLIAARLAEYASTTRLRWMTCLARC
jgi:hypothetical protein